MEVVILVGACVASFLAGMGAYRYMLKRDPDTLERWAREIKAKGQSFK